MEKTEITKKYGAIRDRAFKSYLDMYLVHKCLVDQNLEQANLEDFKAFNYQQSVTDECLKVYQLPGESSAYKEITVKTFNTLIKSWENNNDKTTYKSYFIEHRLISKDDFESFCLESSECGYCDTSLKDIHYLIDQGVIVTKRLSTRGRSLEVDQMDANQGYVKGNLILSCYWCNNAKTDEFTAEEFMPIGQAIGAALRARMK